MSVWTEFDKSLPLTEIATAAKKKGLAISNGKIYDKASGADLNAARFGFAGQSLEEIELAVKILKEVTS
jgi:DNA-binding transcriptional MocR family regulator